MLFGTTLVLLLLIFAVAFLTLSACGHLLNRAALLSEQIAEAFAETQFQARVTRKMLREDFDTKILPTIGWKSEPTTEEQLNKAFAAFGALNKNRQA